MMMCARYAGLRSTNQPISIFVFVIEPRVYLQITVYKLLHILSEINGIIKDLLLLIAFIFTPPHSPNQKAYSFIVVVGTIHVHVYLQANEYVVRLEYEISASLSVTRRMLC